MSASPTTARPISRTPDVLRAISAAARAMAPGSTPIGHCVCGRQIGPTTGIAHGIGVVFRQVRMLCSALRGDDAEDLRFLFFRAIAHGEEAEAQGRCVGCFQMEIAERDHGVIWHAIETAPPELATYSQVARAAADLGEALAALKDDASAERQRLLERAAEVRRRADSFDAYGGGR